MGPGMRFEDFGITVQRDYQRSGTGRIRRPDRRGGRQLRQFGVRIGGRQQPGIGARRQAKTIFYLLNCALCGFLAPRSR